MLTIEQKGMLSAAHSKLMNKMQQLLDRRYNIRGPGTCDKDEVGSAQQLLGDITHVRPR